MIAIGESKKSLKADKSCTSERKKVFLCPCTLLFLTIGTN